MSLPSIHNFSEDAFRRQIPFDAIQDWWVAALLSNLLKIKSKENKSIVVLTGAVLSSVLLGILLPFAYLTIKTLNAFYTTLSLLYKIITLQVTRDKIAEECIKPFDTNLWFYIPVDNNLNKSEK